MTPHHAVPIRAVILCAAVWVAQGCDAPTTESHAERFSVEILGARENLGTGEIVEYAVVPRRNGEVVPAVGAVWTSADASILEFVDPEEGRALARAVGQTTIQVNLAEPRLSDGRRLSAAATVTVTSEVFFGAFSKSTVRFADTVTVLAPEGQEFADSTRVFMTGQGSPEAFVLDRTLRVLSFVVPTQTDAGPVTFTYIGPEEKTLASRTILSRAAGDDDIDAAEPDDGAVAATPLDSLGFDLVQSLHHGRDEDWLTVAPARTREAAVALDWRTGSNLDLWILNDRLEVVDSTGAGDAQPERVLRTFQSRVWYVRVARRDTLSTEPVTYRLTGRPTR